MLILFQYNIDTWIFFLRMPHTKVYMHTYALRRLHFNKIPPSNEVKLSLIKEV